MNETLIKLIELCLADGVITDKERTVIFNKAKELGVSEAECEVILESMEYQQTHQKPANKVINNVIKVEKNTSYDTQINKQDDVFEFLNHLDPYTFIENYNNSKAERRNYLMNLKQNDSIQISYYDEDFTKNYDDEEINKNADTEDEDEFSENDDFDYAENRIHNFKVIELIDNEYDIEKLKKTDGDIIWSDDKNSLIDKVITPPHPLNVIYNYTEKVSSTDSPKGVSGCYIQKSIIGKPKFNYFSGKQQECILPKYFQEIGNPKKVIVTKQINNEENLSNACLVILLWDNDYISCIISYNTVLKGINNFNSFGLFSVDFSSDKYFYKVIKNTYRCFDISSENIIFDKYDTKVKCSKCKNYIDFYKYENGCKCHLLIPGRDDKFYSQDPVFYMPLIKSCDYSYVNGYFKLLKTKYVFFKNYINDLYTYMTSSQENLINEFANKLFESEIAKNDCYNLLRNTSEFIKKSKFDFNKLNETTFSYIGKLPILHFNTLKNYNQFLDKYESILKIQMIVRNILDNFTGKENEQKYLMFKSDIELTGLFFTHYQNVNLEMLNKINLSIQTMSQMIQYYGEKQLEQLNNINYNLSDISAKTDDLQNTLNKISSNTSATNLWMAITVFQNYRTNKYLKKLNNKPQ